MWIAVYILIIATTIATFPSATLNDPYWIPKEFMFNIFGVGVIVSPWFFGKQKIKTFKNVWLGLLMLFTIGNFAWFFYRPLVFNAPGGGVQWNFWNFRPTLNCLIAIFLVATLVENTDTLKRWVNIGRFLAWTGFIMACYAILQWLGFDQLFKENFFWGFPNNIPQRMHYMVTFMSTKFLTSHFLAIVAPLCLMFKEVKYKFFYVVIFLAILLTDCLSGAAAIGATLFLYLLMTGNKRGMFIYGIVMAVVLYLKLHNNIYFLSFSGRLELWKKVIDDSVMSFTGNGFGSFPFKYKSGKLVALSAHNEPLQMYYEGGIALLILISGYLYDIFRRTIYVYFSTGSIMILCYGLGLVSFVLISLAGFPMRFAPLALLGIIYISSLEAQT